MLTRLAGPRELTGVLRGFQDEVAPKPERQHRSAWAAAARQWRPMVLALALALVLWGLQGPGSTVVEVERVADVVSNLLDDYTVESITPENVSVTLRGPQCLVLLADADQVPAQPSRSIFRLGVSQVEYPPGMDAVTVHFGSVKLSLLKTPAGSP